MRKHLLPLLVSSNLAAASLRGRGGRDETRDGGNGAAGTERRLGLVAGTPVLPLQDESPTACEAIVAEAGWVIRDLISEEDGEESDGGDGSASSINSIDNNSYFEESFVCEQADGKAYPVRGTEEQIRSLRAALNGGGFESSEMTIAGMTVVEGVGALGEPSPGLEALLPAGTAFTFVPSGRRRRRLARGAPDDVVEPGGGGRRDLATYSGVKEVLVVRVIDSQGRSPDDPDTMSDNVFGTDGDENNLKSQLEGCAFGALEIRPTNDCGRVQCDAPGVLEVTINIALTSGNRGTIRNAATDAVRAKTGQNLPGPWDHVMYVLEDCYEGDCGWAAYAGGESNENEHSLCFLLLLTFCFVFSFSDSEQLVLRVPEQVLRRRHGAGP